MVHSKFEDYLRDVLALPSAVFEKPSFGYSDAAAKAVFEQVCAASGLQVNVA